MKKQIQLIAIAGMATMFAITSCTKDDQLTNTPQSSGNVDVTENGTNPDEAILNDASARFRFDGYVYVEGNEAGTNMIHIFKQHLDGSLTHMGAVASGGAGNNASLGSQGALALSRNHHFLLAVNAGDNSISAFRVHNDGNLTLTDTESSGGTTPVSVCIHRNVVYTVNAGSDNIYGYTLEPGGDLVPIAGSNLPLSGTGTGPAQISFSPHGNFLYVTEKMTNMITSYHVDGTGLASLHTSVPSVGMTPFGFSIARNKYMVVSNAAGGAPNASSCTSYEGVNTGNLDDVNGAVDNNQSAACWVALTKYDRYAFVTNTDSDNISTYYVSPWGALYLLHASAATTDDAPIDICVAANNYYVYNVNAMSHTISGFRRTFLGDLVNIGSTPGLPDFAAGLVAW